MIISKICWNILILFYSFHSFSHRSPLWYSQPKTSLLLFLDPLSIRLSLINWFFDKPILIMLSIFILIQCIYSILIKLRYCYFEIFYHRFRVGFDYFIRLKENLSEINSLFVFQFIIYFTIHFQFLFIHFIFITTYEISG